MNADPFTGFLLLAIDPSTSLDPTSHHLVALFISSCPWVTSDLEEVE